MTTTVERAASRVPNHIGPTVADPKPPDPKPPDPKPDPPDAEQDALAQEIAALRAMLGPPSAPKVSTDGADEASQPDA